MSKTVQVREFASGLLAASDLETKLTPPPSSWEDDDPDGDPPPRSPARAPELAIRTGPEIKVPPIEGMADPAQRVRILHAFANHELQAVELFAWALLNFPHAPPEFRRGLLSALKDEQRHARLYIARLEELGGRFGDYPLSGYFWGKLDHFSSPQHFVCAMCLTFENANLDHTLEYAAAAERAGDSQTASVLYEVHADEIRHVRFGLTWLDIFKEAHQERVVAWEQALDWPLRPALARGRRLHEEPRRRAGFDELFLERLAQGDVAEKPEAPGAP